MIFATDPITPSKLILDFKNGKDLDLVGTSGKVTAFFKNPVIWKESNSFSDSFRFIFSVDTIEKLVKKAGKPKWEIKEVNLSEVKKKISEKLYISLAEIS